MKFGRQCQLQAPQYDAIRWAQHRGCHGRDDGLGGDAELPGSVEATEARDDVRVGREEVLGQQRDVGVHGGICLSLGREYRGVQEIRKRREIGLSMSE